MDGPVSGRDKETQIYSRKIFIAGETIDER